MPHQNCTATYRLQAGVQIHAKDASDGGDDGHGTCQCCEHQVSTDELVTVLVQLDVHQVLSVLDVLIQGLYGASHNKCANQHRTCL